MLGLLLSLDQSRVASSVPTIDAFPVTDNVFTIAFLPTFMSPSVNIVFVKRDVSSSPRTDFILLFIQFHILSPLRL